MPRRKLWTLNQAAAYLGATRERVLRLELEEAEFPEHVVDQDSDRIYWYADEVEAWANDTNWFNVEEEEDGEDT